jgi:TatD DNase family protein
MYLVDSHCHLDLLELASHGNLLENAIVQAEKQGVGHMLCVCITLRDFPSMLETVKSYPQVSVSVGLHPNENAITEPSVAELVALGSDKKVVAIGETGLDYYRSKGDTKWQRERFRTHIAAAKELNKPLIIHMRDAATDTLTLMREENVQTVGGVMHCFTEDWQTAEAALQLGFYISISGIVTFKNATTVQEVAKKVPLERLLIETDSPFLAPNPYRGKPNEPAYVRHVAEFIAELREISLDEFAKQTTTNFFRLFKEAHQHV